MCLMKDQWVECGNGEKITKQEFLWKGQTYESKRIIRKFQRR